MKVAVVNTSDSQGGAARAAYRLHKGLLAIGESSTFIVQQKSSGDFTVVGPGTKIEKALAAVRPTLDALPLQLYPKREPLVFSTGLLPSANMSNRTNAFDVVNLHWIAGGFVNINAIAAISKPVVWTLHDSWAFTGGCHVPFECVGYQRQCGQCPQLNSASSHDLSSQILRRKKKAWAENAITLVTDGQWLADCARKSPLFANSRIEVINPGLDTNVFRPLDKAECRKILGLPLDAKLILFGAMAATSDRNKGFQFLQPALQKFSATGAHNDAQLIIFGASEPQVPIDFGLRAQYVGRLHDDISLAVLYSAADVMIVPSLQEAFGQTASESMACGTPVVAFNATGLKDIVQHQHDGYLAEPYDVDDLSNGIAWVLADDTRWQTLSINAREKVEREFNLELYANRYLSTFQDVVDSAL
jgi:glycosyltransferase involved in cell wall biosynthesis